MDNTKTYKVGIISDTHGLLRQDVLTHLKNCDYIIHGGDINKESILMELKEIAPLFVVRGNNDKGEWAEKLPEDIYFSINNIKFYMVHNKKIVPKELKKVDVVIFGHSHKFFYEEIENVLWLNPGSCGKRRFDLPLNMIIMNIRDKEFEIEKIDIFVENNSK